MILVQVSMLEMNRKKINVFYEYFQYNSSNNKLIFIIIVITKL